MRRRRMCKIKPEAHGGYCQEVGIALYFSFCGCFFVVNIIHQFVIHAENLFTGMDKHWNIPWRGRPAFHRAGLFFPSIPIGPLVVISSYESFSDAGESRVWFASKNLTPCMMHLNDFLIAQIIAKCHSFPNMYDML